MAYVTLDDYVLSVSHEELSDVLTQAANGYTLSEDQTRAKVEGKAEAKVSNFLAKKFDLPVEFAKTGTARNLALVGVYIDLALCALYRSVSPDDIPEMRDEDCKEAINILTMWRDGDLSLDGVDQVTDPVGKTEFINPIKFISKPDQDPLIFEETTT